MYAVRDKGSTELHPARTDYYRTLAEAEQHVASARMHDRNGVHVGEEYLEIVEVERASRPCKYCGGEVQSDTAEFCRGCYYSGRAADEGHRESIAYFEAQLPGWQVGTEHTGGGCFWMAFHPPGEDTERGYFYIATDGEASLPDVDSVPIRNGWGYVGVQGWDEEEPEYDGVAILGGQVDGTDIMLAPYDEALHARYWDEYPAHCLTDEQVVAAIKAEHERRQQRAAAPSPLGLVIEAQRRGLRADLLALLDSAERVRSLVSNVEPGQLGIGDEAYRRIKFALSDVYEAACEARNQFEA